MKDKSQINEFVPNPCTTVNIAIFCVVTAEWDIFEWKMVGLVIVDEAFEWFTLKMII